MAHKEALRPRQRRQAPRHHRRRPGGPAQARLHHHRPAAPTHGHTLVARVVSARTVLDKPSLHLGRSRLTECLVGDQIGTIRQLPAAPGRSLIFMTRQPRVLVDRLLRRGYTVHAATYYDCQREDEEEASSAAAAAATCASTGSRGAFMLGSKAFVLRRQIIKSDKKWILETKGN
ncbi:hypothetical protein EJB05_53061, partial [Eragrostis curvula]